MVSRLLANATHLSLYDRTPPWQHPTLPDRKNLEFCLAQPRWKVGTASRGHNTPVEGGAAPSRKPVMSSRRERQRAYQQVPQFPRLRLGLCSSQHARARLCTVPFWKVLELALGYAVRRDARPLLPRPAQRARRELPRRPEDPAQRPGRRHQAARQPRHARGLQRPARLAPGHPCARATPSRPRSCTDSECTTLGRPWPAT